MTFLILVIIIIVPARKKETRESEVTGRLLGQVLFRTCEKIRLIFVRSIAPPSLFSVQLFKDRNDWKDWNRWQAWKA